MGLWFDKRYKTYRYIYRDAAGKQHMFKLGKNRKEAQLKANELDRRRSLGELAPLLIRTRIADHLEWFIDYHLSKKRPKTQQSYRFSLKKLMGFFDREGIECLDQVTRQAWEKFEYQILKKEKLSEETRNDIFTALSVFINLAIQNNLILKNPLLGVRRRIKSSRKRLPVIFTGNQIRGLRAAATPAIVPYIDLMLLTGLRLGEIRTLEWEDINTQKRIITIQSKPDIDHIPKDYELRAIDLSDQAMKLLAGLPHKGRFVFDSGRNSPLLAADTFSHMFSRARKAAGIKEGSIHALRRTYASKLEDAGATLSYIKSMLGHESLATTQKYLHPQGEIQKERMLGLSYDELD